MSTALPKMSRNLDEPRSRFFTLQTGLQKLGIPLLPPDAPPAPSIAPEPVAPEPVANDDEQLGCKDGEVDGEIYRAANDVLCKRESKKSMSNVLRFIRGNSRIQIAYLQGCTGMTSRQNFDTLLEMLREHPRLWALNMGEISGSVSPQMMQELLEAISDSNLVAFYYDTSPAFVEFKESVKSTLRANRSKHSLWNCYGEGDPDIIRKCHGMYYHPKNMGLNRFFFNSKTKVTVETQNVIIDCTKILS